MGFKKGSEVRKIDYDIDGIFVDRWSPRAMSGKEITEEDLMSLFEAARWAPSAYNEQPWRFVYARRGSEYWDDFFSLLVEGNQVWAKDAAVLVCLISRKNFSKNDKPNITYKSDSGSAWQNLALQGASKGFVVHGMSGFDFDKAREVLKVPEGYDVIMMFAVGMPGNVEKLPEGYRQMENPSDRKKVGEFVFEGEFKE